MKACIKCGQQATDRSICRQCYNAYMRAYMLDRYHRRRNEALLKLGGKCVDCGAMELLEFDHVDRKTKTFDVSTQHGDAGFWEELKKCVLRCNSCHTEKTRQELTVGHGGGRTGMKNCRCDLCAPLKNEYARQRRASVAQVVRAVSS